MIPTACGAPSTAELDERMGSSWHVTGTHCSTQHGTGLLDIFILHELSAKPPVLELRGKGKLSEIAPRNRMFPCHRGQYDIGHPSGPCSNSFESCLKNQIADLLDEDANREANGLQPLHLAQRYSHYGAVGFAFDLSGPIEERWMKASFQVPFVTGSMLQLEISADSLNFIERFPPGEVCAACSGRTLPMHVLLWLCTSQYSAQGCCTAALIRSSCGALKVCVSVASEAGTATLPGMLHVTPCAVL